MSKLKILKEFWKIRPGNVIVVSGQAQEAAEVVFYRKGRKKRLNIMWRERYGLEVVLEIEGDKVTLWQEIDTPTKFLDELSYEGERFFFVKDDSGCVEMISETAKVEKRSFLPYWTFQAPSGRRLAVKLWNNGFCFYLAEAKPPEIIFP